MEPLPRGSIIDTYKVFGRWPDGTEISDPHQDKARAVDAAQMCEQGGAHVRVERRVERIIGEHQTELEYVETIYGEP